MRLYANRNISFSDIDSVEADQQLELTAEDLASGKPQALRLARFGKVNKMAIFVEDNQSGGDKTVINTLTLIGQPLVRRFRVVF